MRTAGILLRVFLLSSLIEIGGCGLGPEGGGVSADDNDSVYARFAPVKVDIMPLTELAGAGDTEAGEGAQIKAYVSLIDSVGSSVKAPGVFRFELYEKVQRSSEPKGNRIIIWPDIDLTEPVENNKRWRDFLRTYEFSLDFEARGKRSYILQVMCLCPDGKRLSGEFALGPEE